MCALVFCPYAVSKCSPHLPLLLCCIGKHRLQCTNLLKTSALAVTHGSHACDHSSQIDTAKLEPWGVGVLCFDSAFFARLWGSLVSMDDVWSEIFGEEALSTCKVNRSGPRTQASATPVLTSFSQKGLGPGVAERTSKRPKLSDDCCHASSWVNGLKQILEAEGLSTKLLEPLRVETLCSGLGTPTRALAVRRCTLLLLVV